MNGQELLSFEMQEEEEEEAPTRNRKGGEERTNLNSFWASDLKYSGVAEFGSCQRTSEGNGVLDSEGHGVEGL